MGGCVTRYRELSLVSDSVDDVLQPSEVKFYAFDITQEWLERKRDLVIRVHVRQGRLRGVYCARDKPFPNQRRKVWESERYCSCPSRTCDHCYPSCLNEAGGVCTECMLHDDKWERVAHDTTLGGLAAEQGSLAALGNDNLVASQVELAPGALMLEEQSDGDAGGAAGGGGRLFDPPYPHQRDFEFSLRLATAPAADGPHLAPGHFFLTLAAADERVSRALRRQRREEGEPERHATLVTVWIEEALPRGDPRAGNPERVAEAEERARKRLEMLATRREFGRKHDAQQESKGVADAEDALLKEYGLPQESAAARKKQPQAESKHA